eukprot:15387979-Alexandrium_andersonii.AAC.1
MQLQATSCSVDQLCAASSSFTQPHATSCSSIILKQPRAASRSFMQLQSASCTFVQLHAASSN